MAECEKVIHTLECCFDVQSGWKDAVWVCPACPYAKNDEEPCETLAPLLDDAITLLKEQQPRVMTLEEVLGGDECWIEGKSVACGYGDAVLTCDGEHVDFYRPHSVYILDFYEYGLSWRCWTAKPTDKQREATAWK